jgi:hypothetical protein
MIRFIVYDYYFSGEQRERIQIEMPGQRVSRQKPLEKSCIPFIMAMEKNRQINKILKKLDGSKNS